MEKGIAGVVVTMMTINPEPIWLDNLLLDDICSHCEGTGSVYNSDWAEWFENNNKPPNRGQFPDGEPEDLTCLFCQGIGTRLTEAGEAILELIARYHH